MSAIKTIEAEQVTIPQFGKNRRVSKAEYWQQYYDHPTSNYEWNNGYLEEKPVADYANVQLYFWFLELLRSYLRVQPIARTTALEMAFEMIFGTQSSIRKPDLGVVLNSNSIPLKYRDRRYQGIFDLCIESLSDSNKAAIERDTVVKYQEYAQAGIQEYYILDERQRETVFLENVGGLYRPLPQMNGVVQSKVLPGFQFRVEDLYRQPSLVELAIDPVYQGFVLLEYQAERMAKQQETQRAERERAEKERLAAKLRALGIDPETD